MTDKHSPKPVTPTLSAAFTRSSRSSPLTPKLAKPPATTTKRFTPSGHRSPSPSKDDLTNSFLSANVTPRSGSRNSRRDGATSSPTHTPSSTHHSPQSVYSSLGVTSGPNHGHRPDPSPTQGSGALDPRATRAKTWASENVPRPNSYDPSSSPMFFHASDPQPPPTDSDQRSRPGKLSASSFFYADGRQEQTSEDEDSSVSGMQRRSAGLARPIATAKHSAATVPRLRSPNGNDSSRFSDNPRSQTTSHPISPGEGPRLHTLPINRPKEGLPSVSSRHIKSASVDSGPNSTPPREGLRSSPQVISPSDSHVKNGTDPNPTLPPRPRIMSNDSTGSADTPGSALSLGKSDGATAVKTDLATNARTERKILDLEISNSSLLAINRTLEREMRKQHAELRRYRRLSRSGRLSMAPSGRSISGGGLSVTSEASEDTSELSSIHLPDDLSDFSEEESVDESVLTPNSLAEHDARHQARDEKRFYVDLAKHQELLVGSQKMDQSIRRCLGWTEELIYEGQKALEYAVRVSDVELGGRVLSPEELGEAGESTRGLLSPTQEVPTLPSEPDQGNPTSETA